MIKPSSQVHHVLAEGPCVLEQDPEALMGKNFMERLDMRQVVPECLSVYNQ